jgi:hypothetical protein
MQGSVVRNSRCSHPSPAGLLPPHFSPPPFLAAPGVPILTPLSVCPAQPGWDQPRLINGGAVVENQLATPCMGEVIPNVEPALPPPVPFTAVPIFPLVT